MSLHMIFSSHDSLASASAAASRQPDAMQYPAQLITTTARAALPIPPPSSAFSASIALLNLLTHDLERAVSCLYGLRQKLLTHIDALSTIQGVFQSPTHPVAQEVLRNSNAISQLALKLTGEHIHPPLLPSQPALDDQQAQSFGSVAHTLCPTLDHELSLFTHHVAHHGPLHFRTFDQGASEQSEPDLEVLRSYLIQLGSILTTLQQDRLSSQAIFDRTISASAILEVIASVLQALSTPARTASPSEEAARSLPTEPQQLALTRPSAHADTDESSRHMPAVSTPSAEAASISIQESPAASLALAISQLQQLSEQIATQANSLKEQLAPVKCISLSLHNHALIARVRLLEHQLIQSRQQSSRQPIPAPAQEFPFRRPPPGAFMMNPFPQRGFPFGSIPLFVPPTPPQAPFPPTHPFEAQQGGFMMPLGAPLPPPGQQQNMVTMPMFRPPLGMTPRMHPAHGMPESFVPPVIRSLDDLAAGSGHSREHPDLATTSRLPKRPHTGHDNNS